VGRKKNFIDGDYVMLAANNEAGEQPALIEARWNETSSAAAMLRCGRPYSYYIYNSSYIRHMLPSEIVAAKLSGLRHPAI
jgi:hypothetical protein